MGGKFEEVISIIVLAPLRSCSSYNRLPITDNEDKILLVVVVVEAAAVVVVEEVVVVMVVVMMMVVVVGVTA